MPGSNISTIDDRPGTDFDRMSSSHGDPVEEVCSSGTVMSCSTSCGGQAERLGLDLDVRRRELGQGIHRHLPRLVCAGGQYGSTKRNGEEPEAEARSTIHPSMTGGSPSLSRQPIAG